MCFSATASFVAGASLLAIGAMTVKRTERRAELPFAAIPLLFGAQQILEGLIWLTFRFDTPLLNMILTNAYSLFSHVLWPIYVPFAVLVLEPVSWRRKALFAFLAIGIAAGVYLLINMARFPIKSQLVGAHIEYSLLAFLRPTSDGFLFSGDLPQPAAVEPQSHKDLRDHGSAIVRRCVPDLCVVVHLHMVLFCSRTERDHLFALSYSQPSPGARMSFAWPPEAGLESQPIY